MEPGDQIQNWVMRFSQRGSISQSPQLEISQKTKKPDLYSTISPQLEFSQGLKRPQPKLLQRTPRFNQNMAFHGVHCSTKFRAKITKSTMQNQKPNSPRAGIEFDQGILFKEESLQFQQVRARSYS